MSGSWISVYTHQPLSLLPATCNACFVHMSRIVNSVRKLQLSMQQQLQLLHECKYTTIGPQNAAAAAVSAAVRRLMASRESFASTAQVEMLRIRHWYDEWPINSSTEHNELLLAIAKASVLQSVLSMTFSADWINALVDDDNQSISHRCCSALSTAVRPIVHYSV